jgi:hypothetical protein
MAFIRKNFAPLGAVSTPRVRGTGETSPGAPQAFTYATQDAAATVDTSGYFNDVGALLVPGDWIMRTTINSSGVPQTAGTHLVMTVTQAASGVWTVDVADTLALTVTNTD